ncbi:unnamed protein product [Lactuca virosa]|uniref:Uncharacterized protein n=1 Tax=Lactuca virosa TaxID=75947 RepID=A0AAU9LTR5_9ASTR|nr:unnamed protein product [Lactuca virosa]
MNLRIELYNVADDDTTKDYLSAGEPQPYVYFGFFLVYLYFLGFWVNLCFKNQTRFQMIHLLMAMLVWITVLHLICAAADQHDLKVTDTNCCVVVFIHTAFFSDLAFTKASDTSTFGMALSLTDVYPLMVFVCLLIMVIQQTLLQESNSLVFYMVMFYMYRPSVLDEDGEDCKESLV